MGITKSKQVLEAELENLKYELLEKQQICDTLIEACNFYEPRNEELEAALEDAEGKLEEISKTITLTLSWGIILGVIGFAFGCIVGTLL